MSGPYRTSQVPWYENCEVVIYDVCDIDVEIMYQNRVGDNHRIVKRFVADENHYGTAPIVVSEMMGRPGHLRSGKDHLRKFVYDGAKDGYVYIDGPGTCDTYVPWHRIFSLTVIKVHEKSTEVRYTVEKKKRGGATNGGVG